MYSLPENLSTEVDLEISFPDRYSSISVVRAAHSDNQTDLDDQLPTHPDGWMLCMVTRTHEIWPALLEKAVSASSNYTHLITYRSRQYMKLMGGYEFPGSWVSDTALILAFELIFFPFRLSTTDL